MYKFRFGVVCSVNYCCFDYLYVGVIVFVGGFIICCVILVF